MKPVQKTDLNTLFPQPAQHATLVLDRLFSPPEAVLLRLGYRPREMQDKWFIYFENDVLYFHRSWTGFCIYQVSFVPEGQGLRMTRALVSRNAEQYGETRDDRDREQMLELIDRFLLHRNDDAPRT